MINNPPRCCGLGIIHAVADSRGEDENNSRNFLENSGASVAYIHTPVSLEQMQSVTTVVVGMLEAPAVLMRAPGACSPYVAMNCLASDAGGGGMMRSRRNLVRAGQT
jgi:hypothetical protein